MNTKNSGIFYSYFWKEANKRKEKKLLEWSKVINYVKRYFYQCSKDFKHNNSTVTNSVEIVNILNKHFASLPKKNKG